MFKIASEVLFQKIHHKSKMDTFLDALFDAGNQRKKTFLKLATHRILENKINK